MKIIILGGFLGSGKTTVLMSLAKYLVNKHRSEACPTPVAIIENEIGDVGVDDVLLGKEGYDLRSLFAGCVCCTLASDLTLAINSIGDSVHPAYVIIETTGMAYPGSVAQTIAQYGKNCERIYCCVIADAERWDENMEYLDIMLTKQARSADGILVNKIDMVEQADAQRIAGELSQMNPNARVWMVSARNGVDDRIWEAYLGGAENGAS